MFNGMLFRFKMEGNSDTRHLLQLGPVSFRLCWGFIVVSRGYTAALLSLFAEHQLQACRFQQLWCEGLVAPQHGIQFLGQRSNLCPLHCKAGSWYHWTPSSPYSVFIVACTSCWRKDAIVFTWVNQESSLIAPPQDILGNYLETLVCQNWGGVSTVVSYRQRPGMMVDLVQDIGQPPVPHQRTIYNSECSSVMLRLEHPEKNNWLTMACITTTVGYNQLSLQLQSQPWFSVSQGCTHGHLGKAICREHHGLAWQRKKPCFFEMLLPDVGSR